jgi:hypothetical protein
VERTSPGRILDERLALEAYRDTLLHKCTGLTAGQLKERWWFRMQAANADLPFPYDPDQTGQDFEARIDGVTGD